jgi:hypothetical protein
MDKPSGNETVAKSCGAIIIGMPIVAIGLILCLSVIGIIPGIILIVLGSTPLFIVQKRSIEHKVAWQLRDHPLDDTPPPWIVDE